MDKRGIGATLGVLALAAALTGFLTGCGQGAEGLLNRADTLVKVIRSIGEDETDGETEKRDPALPDIDIGDWKYTLVNFETPFHEADSIATGETKDLYLFDERAIDALDAMLAAGEQEGLSLALTSAWRSTAYQEKLFEDKVQRVMAQGYDRETAEELAAVEVARPGTSEHHLGLAVDIASYDYNILDGGYADTPEGQWLSTHCAEYGFILRYPEDKSGITGVIFEPWHFRYVGVEAAGYIMERGLCLEEFLALYA
jgi:D-alanyl-D-alanine carboxypeptidase